MKHLRITTLDADGTLHVFQVPLQQITGYAYVRPPEEGDRKSRLHLTFTEEAASSFPVLFDGSQADEVAKALRLVRPPLSEGHAFGAMLHDDDPR